MIHQSLLRYRGARYSWWALGLCAATAAWFALAVVVFRSGLKRYTSASS